MTERMDIRMEANFNMRINGISSSFIGTECKDTNFITCYYRDCETVENALKWIKSVMTSEKIREQMITFGTYYNYEERNYYRIIKQPGNQYRIIKWDSKYNLDMDITYAKYPAKEVKAIYLELADVVIAKNNEIDAA